MSQSSDLSELSEYFRGLLNYSNEDPLAPIDPLTYRTPEGDSCLHIAIERGDLRIVRLLIDHGLDVNVSGDMGETPLILATELGRVDMVRLLLAHRARSDTRDEMGRTALDIASKSADPEMLQSFVI